jgi:hypothetical protein
MWDEISLKEFLFDAGFKNIIRQSFNTTNSKYDLVHLDKDELGFPRKGKCSLYLEAIK